MKTLLILRHAKSSWSDPTLGDRARSLNARGRSAAASMGKYLAKKEMIPDLIFCSPARRTQETLERLIGQWDGEVETETHNGLYTFSGGQSCMAIIQSTPASVNSLMLIGHNPTMEMLADHLAGSGDKSALAKLAIKFPTAALAVLRFDISTWSDLAEASGELIEFTVPRELPD